MTASELTARVTVTTAIAVLPLALAGGWLGGMPGAVGVLAGGALALFSFRRLVARATAASGSAGWLVTTGLRFAVVTAAVAVLFVQGWAHPLAVLAGYSALPVVVIVHGLRLARESASWT
jgi:ATP synthase I subunit